jgi:HAD domain in Swiss Army Knife RNA repair proteins
MRSEIAQRIMNETPPEVHQKVKEYGDRIMWESKMKKVIFLDIDGVLALYNNFFTNSATFQKKREWAKRLKVPYGWDAKAVKALNHILDNTNAEIVLSSDWRLHWDLIQLKEIFDAHSVVKSPVAITSKISSRSMHNLEFNRVGQIEDFIAENNVGKWIAVDDMHLAQWAKLDIVDRFVRTNQMEGIKQSGLKERIIKMLNE